MGMSNKEFEIVLRKAIAGDSKALEQLLELYEPMIYKYSCVKGVFNEDIHQQLLLTIALNIHKFPL